MVISTFEDVPFEENFAITQLVEVGHGVSAERALKVSCESTQSITLLTSLTVPVFRVLQAQLQVQVSFPQSSAALQHFCCLKSLQHQVAVSMLLRSLLHHV